MMHLLKLKDSSELQTRGFAYRTAHRGEVCVSLYLSRSLSPVTQRVSLLTSIRGLIMTGHEMSSGPGERGGHKQREIRLDQSSRAEPEPAPSTQTQSSDIKEDT